ncbi:MAG: SHOCT domain-containing protein [Bacillota bacterium]|nr:SHOCT domain-containing protein [Bacillota bacterium]
MNLRDLLTAIAGGLALILLIAPIVLHFIPGLDNVGNGTPGYPTTAGAANTYQVVATEVQAGVQADNNGDVISALKEYKDLVDAGALTPEEFEEVKKKLLGL